MENIFDFIDEVTIGVKTVKIRDLKIQYWLQNFGYDPEHQETLEIIMKGANLKELDGIVWIINKLLESKSITYMTLVTNYTKHVDCSKF